MKKFSWVHFFVLTLCFPITAMENNAKKLKMDVGTDIIIQRMIIDNQKKVKEECDQIQQSLKSHFSDQNSSTTQPKYSTFNDFFADSKKMIKMLINKVKGMKKSILENQCPHGEFQIVEKSKKKILDPVYHSQKTELYQKLHSDLTNSPKAKHECLCREFIDQRNKLLTEFYIKSGNNSPEQVDLLMKLKINSPHYSYKKVHLYSILRGYLKAAFDPDHHDNSLYTLEHKQWLLLRGIESNQLNEAIVENGYVDDTFTYPTDPLSILVKPLFAAIKLQSLKCISALYNKFTHNGYRIATNWNDGKFSSKLTAEKIVYDLKSININSKKAEAIVLMLKQIETVLPEEGKYYELPMPQIVAESFKNIPLTKQLFEYSLENAQTTLQDLKDTLQPLKLPSHIQTLILQSLHSRISYFEPELLRQLSLKESLMLKQFWNSEFYNLRDYSDGFEKLLEDHGYTSEVINKVAQMDALFRDLNKELGLHKKHQQ